jgi:hypothetical protein
MLWRAGGGLGGVALAHLSARSGLLAAPPPRAEGGLHRHDHASKARRVDHAPKARRVIQLFMNGGVSQMDTFDHKPELARRHGEKVDFGLATAVTSAPGAVMKSPFEWRQHGECGRWVSSVFPRLAACTDDMAFLMAMVSKTNVHGPASYLQTTGFLEPGFPCAGAWVSYALGSEADDLPSFVVLPDARGLPYNNKGNFSSGFLPNNHQATIIQPGDPVPIANLRPSRFARGVTAASEARGLDLLRALDRAHLAENPGDSRLEARIASYELAARLQLSAPRVLDLAGESARTRAMYGLDEEVTAGFGRQCLLARRLIEKGVRFVQVWSGAGGNQGNWDNHTDIARELPFIARQVDGPIAALLLDLKARGLLEDTLVVWTSEFGRMPFTQGATGRDHNGGTFVTWLAGAGVRGGASHGASDEFSFRAAEGETWGYDLHATMLHLLGIDHERLTVRENGIDRRLTDVHGRVVHEILEGST